METNLPVYYSSFIRVCEKRFESDKQEVDEFLRQMTFLKKFKDPEQSEFLLLVIPELFGYAKSLLKYTFCMKEKPITLGEMGKQVSLYLETITTNASDLFNQKSTLRSVLISEICYDHLKFKTEFLGRPDKDKDIERSAQSRAKELNEKWQSCQKLEKDVGKIEERFLFLLEKISKKNCKIDTNPIQHYVKELFLLEDVNSKEKRKYLHRASKQSLSDLCSAYMFQLYMDPYFSPVNEKTKYSFYPEISRLFAQRSVEHFSKKITKIIDEKNSVLPKEISLVFEEVEQLLEKKRDEAAELFEIYAQGIDYFAAKSSDFPIHLGQYVFVFSEIKGELKKISMENKDIEIEVKALKMKIDEAVEQSKNIPLLTLNPKMKMSVPGISSEYDGLLMPIEPKEIKNLLFSEIPLSRSIFSQKLRIPKTKEIVTSEGKICGHSWGKVSAKGDRDRQEDDDLVGILECAGGKKYPFFAVMDGHRGSTAAEYVKRNLISMFTLWINFALQEIQSKKEISEEEKMIIFSNALMMAPVGLDALLDLLINKETKITGTTLAMALLDDEDNLWSVNVGDSRVVFCHHQKVIQLTRDAKINDPFFRARVLKRGGSIKNDYVSGILGMASSLGDRDVQGRSSEGDVKCYKLLKKDYTLVLSSDGITDCMGSHKIGRMASSEKDPRSGAQKLVEEASSIYNRDNMTAIVVKLSFQESKN